MTIEHFAEQFRLHISRDECNDKIIQGKRAHLYFDGKELCLMGLDVPVAGMSTAAIESLGRKCWHGSIWRDEKRRGRRDVKIQGIPKENWLKAIRLARCRQKPVMTDEQKQLLASRLKSPKPAEKTPLYTPDSIQGPSDKEKG